MTPVHRVGYPDLKVASVLAFPFPIPALLTLRAVGEMGASGGELNETRRAFLDKVSVPRDRFVSLHQIHSRSVLGADPQTYGSDADGMVTSDRRLCLGVTVADCMPIYLYDRSSGAFGILHSGWRGTGILADAVHAMARLYDAEAAELTVLLGPAIGVCCYRVDAERAALFQKRWGSGAAVRRDGEWYLDMRRANLDL
ncbi:MAG TPA: polyphenol oxidase family protein, partial [Spirochaetia bacterium]|nr:polyphenol oxidase family protein [Spirochaetia bacterium]